MSYKTLAAPAEAEFIEKKSRFIGYISPVQNEQEAIDFINKIRAMHRKATHNCYAYILRDNNISRHSDDGEPSGTAGVPIYEVLRKEGLTDVCCVVTRYFGGILLGAGGLVRAYSKGAKIAIDAAQIKDMCMAERLRITLDYGLYGRIGALLAQHGFRSENEDFAADVSITGVLRQENAEAFTAELVDLCNGRVAIDSLEVMECDFGG